MTDVPTVHERRRRPKVKFAPEEAFSVILEYCVIPTFDLVVEFPGQGVIVVRRIIAPYENMWALPGLRMLKPEGIDDVLARIAEDELGITVDLVSKRYIGQYVGRFRTEYERQDISTGYAVRALDEHPTLNARHFSGHRFIGSEDAIPANGGAMYKYYLARYFREMRIPED